MYRIAQVFRFDKYIITKEIKGKVRFLGELTLIDGFAWGSVRGADIKRPDLEENIAGKIQ